MPYATDQLRARYNSQTTLFSAYTAGAGTMVVVDGSLLPTAVPFAILVTRAAGGLSRPFTCTALAGNTLTVVVSEGQANDLNFLAGDAVENIVAADAQERLRAFALGHTHTGGNDGPALPAGGVTDHALLTNVTANQHHAQSHAIGGADHSGTLAHTALGSVTADQHHAQAHSISGTDHSGTLAHSALSGSGSNSHAVIDSEVGLNAAHRAATAAVHGVVSSVVGTTDAQTLSNKTLTTPSIADLTNAQHLHTNAASGGAIAGAPAFATPAILLGASAAAGSAGTIIRSDGTIAAFDATAPSTQAFGDAAVVGTVAFAAHRDHKHGFPTIALGNLPTVPYARAYHTANQTTTTGTPLTLQLNSELVDTDAIHDPATNNERLTCKTAGTYLIVGMVAFQANATGYRQARIVHQVAGVIGIQVNGTAGSGVETVVQVVSVWTLAVNDYVILVAVQGSGGALDVNASIYYSPHFAMYRIG